MAKKLLARTIDQVTSLDLFSGGINNPGYWVHAENTAIDFGIPSLTSDGEKKSRSREDRIVDADWTNRTISFRLHIKGTDLDDLRSKYQDLLSVITNRTWELVFNNGGTNERDRYFDCYSVVDVPPVQSFLTWVHNDYDLSLKIEAKPFAREDAFNLPRNYVKDSTLSEDWDGDGYPNSFVADDSATAPNGSVTVVDGSTRMQIWGGGGAGRYLGIKQTMSGTASIPLYGNLEVNLSGVTDGATVDIFTDGTANYFGLSANTAGWVKLAPTDNMWDSTGSADVHIRLNAPNANSAAVLLVRNILVTDTDITGKQYEDMHWTSETSTSPSILRVKNVPGDVPATCLVRHMPPDNSSHTPQFIIGHPQDNFSPITDLSGNDCGYIYKWKDTSTGGTNALGGKCSSVQSHGSELKIGLGGLKGSFLVLARMKSDNTGSDVNMKLYSDIKQNAANPYTTTLLTPFTVADKWYIVPLGVLDIPIGIRPDWDTWLDNAYSYNSLGINSSSETGSGWQIDYIVFVPCSLHSISRTNTLTTTGLHCLIFDTISDSPGAYEEYLPSSVNFSVGQGAGYTYQWFWQDYSDFASRIVSVKMEDLESGGSFSSLSDTVTLVSTSGYTRRFQTPVGWDENFTGTYGFAIPFHLTSAATKGSIPVFNLPDGFWLDVLQDNDFIVMGNDYVNSATQEFNNDGNLVSFRISPRFIL